MKFILIIHLPVLQNTFYHRLLAYRANQRQSTPSRMTALIYEEILRLERRKRKEREKERKGGAFDVFSVIGVSDMKYNS